MNCDGLVGGVAPIFSPNPPDGSLRNYKARPQVSGRQPVNMGIVRLKLCVLLK